MKSVDSIGYGTSNDLESETEDNKCNKIINQYKTDWLWFSYKRKRKRT